MHLFYHMRIARLIFFVLLSSLVLSCSSARRQAEQNQDSGIIYGPGFAFSLTAPDGWRLDETAAEQQNMFAVVLPEKKNWNDAEVRMYASIIRIDTSQGQSMRTVMNRDKDYFMQRSGQFQITGTDTIYRGEETVFLREYRGISNEPYKITGYIDEGPLITLIGMGSTNRELYNQSLPAFRSLLRSYQFFESSSKVILSE